MKRITKENLLERDDPGLFSNLSQDLWVEFLSKSQISKKVPEDISRLLEVVRGSMAYGWFFYPLMTLASEQCFRVLETAVFMRCDQLKIPLTEISKDSKNSRNRRFNDLIDDLHKIAVINSTDRIKWEGARSLRNQVSHPKGQMLLVPGQTIANFDVAVGLVNRLFEKH
jgi:hypothetical protein